MFLSDGEESEVQKLTMERLDALVHPKEVRYRDDGGAPVTLVWEGCILVWGVYGDYFVLDACVAYAQCPSLRLVVAVTSGNAAEHV